MFLCAVQEEENRLLQVRFGCRYKDESQQTFATTFAIRRKNGDKLGYCIFFIGGESIGIINPIVEGFYGPKKVAKQIKTDPKNKKNIYFYFFL